MAKEMLSSTFSTVAEMEAAQPPLWHEGERVLQLRCATLAGRANGRASLAVVDDDPTGTQTVHSVSVLAEWSVSNLAGVIAMDRPAFFLLANTRALPAKEAQDRAEEIGRNLRAAASQAGVGPLSSVVSRGDSTLRGHYPYETDALARGLGWVGASAPTIVLAPFFKEGGRLTAGDFHYVAGPEGSAGDGGATLTLAGETEFARDRVFGYKSSFLPSWIKEKNSDGKADLDIRSLSLETIRVGGPDAVAEIVIAAPSGSVVVANSIVPRDMQVVALGCLIAELARGPTRPLLYRSAGAFVAARAGIPPRPLLEQSELAPVVARPSEANPSGAGLVVVGSYVGKSSDQLSVLLRECQWLTPIELSVSAFIRDDMEVMSAEQTRVFEALRASLTHGNSAVLYTSRTVLQDDGAGGLHIGQRVTDALCDITQRALKDKSCAPTFLVAKGGITSNDIAVRALAVKRAEVIGQVVPGVPVWRCGAESNAPGLAYVVFPGNVGAADDLARVARRVAGKELTSKI